MNDVFKNLGISLKGAKSVFNFLSDGDLKNLSAFFVVKPFSLRIILEELLSETSRESGVFGFTTVERFS